MAKRGRPKIGIDWDKVDAMCKIQCTGEEVASVLNIDYDTLQSACKREKKVKFSEYSVIKKAGGRASLKRRQWLTSENGNVTMQIWLGKQWLGQTDKVESNNMDELKGTININRPPKPDIIK